MAAALCVTPSLATLATVAACGAFGHRVGRMLVEPEPNGPEVLDGCDIERAFEQGSGTVIVALWRPDPRLCERADELAFQHSRTWLPIVMDHPVIRVGPLVRPPAGPCFGCSYRRQAQHSGRYASTAALHAAYEADPNLGPEGYLPHHARLAAAIARRYLLAAVSGEADEAGSTPADGVVTLRLTRHGMPTARVIACHDCPRCSAVGQERSSARLAAAITGMDISAGSAGRQEADRQCL
jgi:bacteriocin biosynthesis cyclodehydratase domain-containing protein